MTWGGVVIFLTFSLWLGVKPLEVHSHSSFGGTTEPFQS
jgi:hypothetical protein